MYIQRLSRGQTSNVSKHETDTRSRSEHPHRAKVVLVLGNGFCFWKHWSRKHSKRSWEPDPMCVDDNAQINLLTAKAENQIHFKLN